MSVVLPSQARHSGADSRAGGFAGYFSSVGQPEEFAAAALNLGSNQTAARLTIAPQLAIATWTGFARDPDVATVGPVTCCLSGSPRMAGISNDAAGVDRLARAVAEAYLRHGLAQTLAALRGAFAVVLADRSAQQIAFAVDRLGIERLCYAPCTDGVAFGHSIAAVTDNAHVTPHVSRQSILDYLYFHAIPSPRTIFREVLKVEPATAVVCK